MIDDMDDSVVFDGDDIEDCREQWYEFAEDRPSIHSEWSEVLED
jgi:hypothetical protein